MADRFYANFHGGLVFSSTSDDVAFDTDPTTGSTPPFLGPTIVGQGISKPGYLIGAAIGKHIGNGLSVEGEFNYSNSAIDHNHLISTNGVPTPADIPASGSGSLLTGMINGFVSLPAGPIRPYVGVGAGVAYFMAHNIKSPPSAPPGAVLNGNDFGLAAQFLAGADFQLSDSNSLGGRYRYVYATGFSLMDGGYKHDFSVTAQSIEFVLTHHFAN